MTTGLSALMMKQMNLRNSIEELVGYFNAQFLMEQTGIDTEVFDALRQGASTSERVMQIIQATCGYDSFVEAAISADGRGVTFSQVMMEKKGNSTMDE